MVCPNGPDPQPVEAHDAHTGYESSASACAPISLLQGAACELNTVASDTNPLIEVVLDSGAVEHVADNLDAPGYPVDASKRTIASFSAANGEPIENRGQMTLNLTTSSGHKIQSHFQTCDVAKPLWSVGKICDAGCNVMFTKAGAVITHEAYGKELSRFERTRGGLYMASMPLGKPPAEASSSTFRRPDNR